MEVGLLATARSCDPPNKNNNNPPEQQRQQTHGEGPKGGWARARCARANAGRSDDTLNTAVAMAARTTTTAAAEADAHSSPYAESCSCSPRLALSRWRSPSPLSVSSLHLWFGHRSTRSRRTYLECPAQLVRHPDDGHAHVDPVGVWGREGEGPVLTHGWGWQNMGRAQETHAGRRGWDGCMVRSIGRVRSHISCTLRSEGGEAQ